MFCLAPNRLERAVLDLLPGSHECRTRRSNVWPAPHRLERAVLDVLPDPDEFRTRRSNVLPGPE